MNQGLTNEGGASAACLGASQIRETNLNKLTFIISRGALPERCPDQEQEPLEAWSPKLPSHLRRWLGGGGSVVVA